MNRVAAQTVGNRIKRLCSVPRLGEPPQNTAMNGVASISIVVIAFLTTCKGMIIIIAYLVNIFRYMTYIYCHFGQMCVCHLIFKLKTVVQSRSYCSKYQYFPSKCLVSQYSIILDFRYLTRIVKFHFL